MGKMEYQCPCGARVEYAGVMTRCASCGRRLDPSWKRVQEPEPQQQEPPRTEYDAPRRPAAAPDEAQQEPPLRHRRTAAEETGPAEPVYHRAEPQEAAERVQERSAPQSSAEPAGGFAAVEKKTLRLEYQGRALEMPEDCTTGEIGRAAVGAEVLAGHLLVSRVHVRFSIDRLGRLFVLDQSRNGSWFTHADTTRPVSREHLELLTEGDTLWLYDVPLMVRKDG